MSYNLNYNNNENDTNLDSVFNDKAADQHVIAKYITKVYGWMFLALCLTGITAFLVASSDFAQQIMGSSRFVFFGLFLLQLFLVGFLSLRINKLSSGTATAIFLGYAILTGVTFSVLLLAYPATLLAQTFGITAGTFAVMSAVGYFTKKDLTSFGRLMMMALIGIIIASVVNFFTQSATLYWIISYVGVAVFVGLIAYDTQKIKQYALLEVEEDRKKGAIMGALALYLDFINLFLMLLRILGGGRKD
ncbi:MAG: Bax inhibitor-1/YccA family protein [Sphingobacteriales bacterium]|nr:MAG: Bax inhibitor-1/YccA family protein [Sphingobacteriales bacterium]